MRPRARAAWAARAAFPPRGGSVTAFTPPVSTSPRARPSLGSRSSSSNGSNGSMVGTTERRTLGDGTLEKLSLDRRASLDYDLAYNVGRSPFRLSTPEAGERPTSPGGVGFTLRVSPEALTDRIAAGLGFSAELGLTAELAQSNFGLPTEALDDITPEVLMALASVDFATGHARPLPPSTASSRSICSAGGPSANPPAPAPTMRGWCRRSSSSRKPPPVPQLSPISRRDSAALPSVPRRSPSRSGLVRATEGAALPWQERPASSPLADGGSWASTPPATAVPTRLLTPGSPNFSPPLSPAQRRMQRRY